MPNWEQFLNQHVLDPTEFPHWGDWGQEEWNQWLQLRLETKYGSKPLNSVVIARPAEILEAFLHPTIGHNAGEDFYWSEGRFQIFVMERKRGGSLSYDVRRLPPMYFLALIHRDPNRPVHFHGQCETKITSGQLPRSFNHYPLVL